MVGTVVVFVAVGIAGLDTTLDIAPVLATLVPPVPADPSKDVIVLVYAGVALAPVGAGIDDIPGSTASCGTCPLVIAVGDAVLPVLVVVGLNWVVAAG